MSEEEVKRRLESANWTMDQFEEFLNGPGLLRLLEAHPRFAEELSRSFFREYPELLSKFVSDQSEPHTKKDTGSQDKETTSGSVRAHASRSRSSASGVSGVSMDSSREKQRSKEKQEKIKEIAHDCTSLSREVYLFKEVKNHLKQIIPHDEVVLYLTTDDKKFLYECFSSVEAKKKTPDDRPFEAEQNASVAASVAATGIPVRFDFFNCGTTRCNDRMLTCTCVKFPKSPKKSLSVMCQVLTDCDKNLLAVYELRRNRNGTLPPFSEDESIQMLHILTWGGITINSALAHKRLKDEKEMIETFVSFEEELLQQMHLVYYQVGKLCQVIQKLIPRTSDVWVFLISEDDQQMRVKTTDEDGILCRRSDSDDRTSFEVRQKNLDAKRTEAASSWGMKTKARWREWEPESTAADCFVMPLRSDVDKTGYSSATQVAADSNVPELTSGQLPNEGLSAKVNQATGKSTEIPAVDGNHLKVDVKVDGISFNRRSCNDSHHNRNRNALTKSASSNLLLDALKTGSTFTEASLQSWPVGTGISGAAAAEKKIFNVANVKDHPKYSREIDNLKPNIDVKGQLCVPVFMELDDASVVEGRRVCAVITLVSELEGLFSRREVDLVSGLANCCGHAFVQGQQFEKFHNAELQRIVNVELHAAHSEPSSEQMVELKAYIETMTIPEKLDKLDFCGWHLSRIPKVALLIHMFDRLFEKKFDYDKQILGKFFLVVSINYRNEVPYHNFNHAFEVTQKIFTILICCMHGFTLLECVALFLSAICHDIDHRGLTNKFNNDQSTLLASLHQDATMEHHHFRMTIGLLTHGETNFLMNWPARRYSELISCIKFCILSTDLPTGRNHSLELMNMYEGDAKIDFEWNCKEKRRLLMSVLMSIADFHISYLSWSDYREILEPLLQEFWAQGELEERMGRKIEAAFDRKEAKNVPKMQCDFLSFLPLPLATFLARIFEDCGKTIVDNIKALIHGWKKGDGFLDYETHLLTKTTSSKLALRKDIPIQVNVTPHDA